MATASCTSCAYECEVGATVCPDCGADPAAETRPCPECRGTGIVNVARLPWNEIDATCPTCGGERVVGLPYRNRMRPNPRFTASAIEIARQTAGIGPAADGIVFVIEDGSLQA